MKITMRFERRILIDVALTYAKRLPTWWQWTAFLAVALTCMT